MKLVLKQEWGDQGKGPRGPQDDLGKKMFRSDIFEHFLKQSRVRVFPEFSDAKNQSNHGYWNMIDIFSFLSHNMTTQVHSAHVSAHKLTPTDPTQTSRQGRRNRSC